MEMSSVREVDRRPMNSRTVEGPEELSSSVVDENPCQNAMRTATRARSTGSDAARVRKTKANRALPRSRLVGSEAVTIKPRPLHRESLLRSRHREALNPGRCDQHPVRMGQSLSENLGRSVRSFIGRNGARS